MVEQLESQKWLTNEYESNESKKSDTVEIRLKEGIELKGELKIDSYPKLKKIFLSGAKGITALEVVNCPAVEVLFFSDNKITKIGEWLKPLTNLRKLGFADNKVEGKIDFSGNKKLQMLYFRANSPSLEFAGLEEIDELSDWNSSDTFPLSKLLKQAKQAAGEEELKEIAKELGLDVKGKTLEEIKKAIKDEIEKNKKNKEELNRVLPGLINSDGKVDDKKLGEIKDKTEKGDKYQQLVNDSKNAPIINSDKTEIDPSKLSNELSKSNDYAELVKKNTPDLVNSDGTKIDQAKIDALKVASGDVKNATDKLGVSDLKEALAAKLGNAKLSDINAPKTLEDVLKENKALGNMIKGIGIDPNNTAEVEKGIRKINVLVKRVKEIYGENYEDKLEVQEYQNYIEVNTNKK